MTLTAWVLLVIPLLTIQLTLVIVNAPGMARTFAQSLSVQVRMLTTSFARGDFPAGLVGMISAALLVLPVAATPSGWPDRPGAAMC